MKYIHLASLNDLLTRKLITAKSDAYSIVIALVEDTVYALEDMCSHEDSCLNTSSLYGDQVKCPLHGKRFSLSTGEALDDPAVAPLTTYDVKIEGDDILVYMPV